MQDRDPSGADGWGVRRGWTGCIARAGLAIIAGAMIVQQGCAVAAGAAAGAGAGYIVAESKDDD